MMKKCTAILLSLALLLTLLSAQAFAAEEAEAALAEGMGYWWGTGPDGYDMKKAEAAFQQAADLGSADAWYWLGDLASYGVEKGQMKQAMAYYQKAADLGSGLGMYGLGMLYRQEKWGIKGDFKKAKGYFQQAIDAGCLAGYIGLGMMYEYGNGVEKDGNKALEYYEKAADAEDWFVRNNARQCIGLLYYDGVKGFEADYAKGLEWAQKAADEGFVNAYYSVGYIYQYPTDSSEPDYAKVVEWYEKAAECGRPYNLGVCYEMGEGVQKNLKTAIELYKQSIDGGRDAVNCLAVLANNYLAGRGVKKNTEKALEYANRALTASGEYRGTVKQDTFGVGLAVQVLDWLGQ